LHIYYYSFLDADIGLIVAVGRQTGTVDNVEVISTNSSVGLQLPRAPYKIDNPLSFNYNGSMTLCGGRTKTSYVLESCVTLDYKNAMGVKNEYLIWRYKSPMPVPILHAAVATIELNGNTYAWVTGKSLSESLIFASTNPQYEDSLVNELQVQYMKIPSSEHGENIQNNFCTQHVLPMFCKKKSF
jgi:hypothetical protein